MEDLFLILIFINLGSICFIIFYIPNRIDIQEEKVKLYFKELTVRLNRFDDELLGTKKKIKHKNNRFTAPVAVHLVLMKEDKVLLLRRFNTGYEDGNYSVVAGHLDGNEGVKSAMIREAKEEAGIDIKKEDLRVVGVMHRMAEDERIDYFLKAEKWNGETQNMEPHKCDELKWYPIEDLPQNIIPYVRKGIENTFNEISFDEFGWGE